MKHYMQNRKARLAAGIAAATLAFGAATASPALAQGADVGNAFADDGGIAIGGDTNVRFVDASQFQFAAQGQFGDANANAFDGSEAVAVVSSEQGITQNQVNGGFGADFDFDGIEDVFDEDDDNDGIFDDFE
ncbi:MAG TPA: hypothetical protein VGR18_08565 [Rubrobacter sp.]|nr:hypothetical protein [Rubrobacter sp.]